MRVRVRVPATSANLGPGFDALGLALDLWNEVDIDTDGEAGAVALEGRDAALMIGRENLALTAMRTLAAEHGRALPPFSMTLRNAVPQFGKPKGAIVGSDVGTFTVVSQSSGLAKTTAKLPGGTVRSAGTIRQRSPERVPVTGGTGAYKDARGVMELKSKAGGTKFHFIFHFAG